MTSDYEPKITIEDHTVNEKQQPSIENQSDEFGNNFNENDIEKMNGKPVDEDSYPLISMNTLQSSQKIESTAERGILTFLKCLIGSGILALPYVIQKVGLIPAWILLISIGWINFRTMGLVNEVANDMGISRIGFGRLSEKVTGRRWFRYLADINVYVMQIGGILPGIIFIGQHLEKISCIYNWGAFCGVKWMQVLLMLAFALPIGSITDLHYLSIPSGIALLIQLIFYITFIVICGQRMHQNGIEVGSFTAFDLNYLPIAFASILFAYEGIGLLLEIRSSVTNNKEFNKVLTYTFLASTMAYSVFGTMGKLAFGDDVQSVIFLNLNQDNQLILFLEIGYLLGLMIALPTMIFPPIRIFEGMKVLRPWLTDKETGKKSKWKRQLIRQPLLILIVLMAAVAPSFNVVISLLGGLNFTILSFVIPVVLYNTRFKEDPKKRTQRYINWLILIIGIILGSIATVESFQELFTSTSTF